MKAMNKRIALEGQIETVGEGGRKTFSYPAISSVWAAIEPMARPAQIVGDQLDMVVSHRITIPYHASYLEVRQVRFGARVFDVKSLINVSELNECIELHCQERL